MAEKRVGAVPSNKNPSFAFILNIQAFINFGNCLNKQTNNNIKKNIAQKELK